MTTPKLAASLVDLIAVVPELGGRVGTTLAGGSADPTMSSIEIPAAWVVFDGNQDLSQGDGRTAADSRYQSLLCTFRAVVVLPYGLGEADFVENQLKLLDDIASAVRGETPDTGNGPGARPWLYQGCSLLGVEPDRVMYNMTFQTQSFNLKA